MKLAKEEEIMTQLSILRGNLGKDPEIRYTANNSTKVATFSLAVYRANPKDKDKPFTDWFNVVAYGSQADVVEKHLKKGTNVVLFGKFRTRDYEKDGKKVYVTEFWMDEAAMILKKNVVEETGSIWQDDQLPF